MTPTKPFLQKAVEKFLMTIVGGRQKYLRLLVGTIPTDGGDDRWSVVLGIDTGTRFYPMARMLTEREATSFKPAQDLPDFDISQSDDTLNEHMDNLAGFNLSADGLLLFFAGGGSRIDPEQPIDAAVVSEIMQDGGM